MSITTVRQNAGVPITTKVDVPRLSRYYTGPLGDYLCFDDIAWVDWHSDVNEDRSTRNIFTRRFVGQLPEGSKQNLYVIAWKHHEQDWHGITEMRFNDPFFDLYYPHQECFASVDAMGHPFLAFGRKIIRF